MVIGYMKCFSHCNIKRYYSNRQYNPSQSPRIEKRTIRKRDKKKSRNDKNALANLEKLWKDHRISKRTKLGLIRTLMFPIAPMGQSQGPLMPPVGIKLKASK